jgi:hypothetical protein
VDLVNRLAHPLLHLVDSVRMEEVSVSPLLLVVVRLLRPLAVLVNHLASPFLHLVDSVRLEEVSVSPLLLLVGSVLALVRLLRPPAVLVNHLHHRASPLLWK